MKVIALTLILVFTLLLVGIAREAQTLQNQMIERSK